MQVRIRFNIECGLGRIVAALGGIKNAIDEVNEFVASTAAAVEEQNVVTSDTSANMQKAASELAA
jgi:methyl-accepting chemotaxis protein